MDISIYYNFEVNANMGALTVKDLSSLYGYYRHYSAMVFNTLNGKINNIIQCNHMEFMGERTNPLSRSFVLGTNFADVILISLVDIFQCAEDMKLETEEELKGLIIFVIAHELSHLDQKIPFKIMNKDTAIKQQIENANDANALHFLEETMMCFKHFFGEFNLNGVYKMGKSSTNYYLYQKIHSLEEKIFNILEYFVDRDEEFINLANILSSFNNPDMELYYTVRNTNIHLTHKILERGVWVSPRDTMEFLRSNLSIKTMAQTCIKQNDRDNIIQLIFVVPNLNMTYPVGCVLNPGDRRLISVL